MKGLILLANHFEDVEALIVIDMLRRAKITIDMVSVTNSLELITQSNISLKAEYLLEDIDLDDYDFLVVPGGKAVFETHINSEKTLGSIYTFAVQNKLIASICAAPILFGKLGLLNGKDYVCFPSCKEDVEGGSYQSGKKVVVTSNIITSKAAGTTFDFAYEIIKYLKGSEEANKVLNSVYYKN